MVMRIVHSATDTYHTFKLERALNTCMAEEISYHCRLYRTLVFIELKRSISSINIKQTCWFIVIVIVIDSYATSSYDKKNRIFHLNYLLLVRYSAWRTFSSIFCVWIFPMLLVVDAMVCNFIKIINQLIVFHISSFKIFRRNRFHRLFEIGNQSTKQYHKKFTLHKWKLTTITSSRYYSYIKYTNHIIHEWFNLNETSRTIEI